MRKSKYKILFGLLCYILHSDIHAFGPTLLGRLQCFGSLRAKAALAYMGIRSLMHPDPSQEGQIQSNKPHYTPTIFAHGLGGNKKQGTYYHTIMSRQGFIEGPLVAPNFPDHEDTSNSCLGQEADYKILHEVSKKYTQVIRAGVSRGAAATINDLGVNKPNNVIAVVLESPFDHVRSVSDTFIGRAGWIPGIGWSAHKAISYMHRGYNPNGIQPIEAIDKISHDIPILIVCSKEDKLIPHTSSLKLYKKLIASGHKKAYILITETGPHANILWNKDGELYRNVVHAFYKVHNLPHNTLWADAGQKQLKMCQPSLDELEKTNSNTTQSWFSSLSKR